MNTVRVIKAYNSTHLFFKRRDYSFKSPTPEIITIFFLWKKKNPSNLVQGHQVVAEVEEALLL